MAKAPAKRPRATPSSGATSKSRSPRNAAPPPSEDDSARPLFQFRVSAAQRQVWKDAPRSPDQKESAWAREGLDAWAKLWRRAAELDTTPHALIDAALEDHARVAAAVAELTSNRTLSASDKRLLRVLSPSEWMRLHRDD